jgi:hypothetical protein
MIAKRLVPPLPQPERRQSLDQFLRVLDQHPNLAHFRAIATTGPERQLALLAALERSVQVGSSAANPPSPGDEADQLLCDILDCIDRHPDLSRLGSAYGALRHLANLQAFGVWNAKGPVSQPSARELFTTQFSRLTSDPPTTLPLSNPNSSPVPQVFAPNGELIRAVDSAAASSAEAPASPQTLDGVLVVQIAPDQSPVLETSSTPGIIHHDGLTPGEQCTGSGVNGT